VHSFWGCLNTFVQILNPTSPHPIHPSFTNFLSIDPTTNSLVPSPNFLDQNSKVFISVVLPGLRSVHGASVRSVQAVSTGLPLMYITNTTTGPLMGGVQRAYAVSYALVCPTTLHHQASGWSGMCVTRQSSKVSFRLPGLLLRTAVATLVHNNY
jgi:hypothetical protein